MTTTTTTQVPSLEGWLLLHQAYGLVYKHLDHCAAKLGQSTAMAMPLLLLQQADTPLRLSQLARLLVQEAQSVTSLVDRLEARGLVRREPDGRDRRAIKVVLTATGDVVAAQLQAAFMSALEESFAPLSVRDRQTLSRQLVGIRAQGAQLLGWNRSSFDGAAIR
jgi:DNA-binding MarR family transcriptional regulator